MVLVACSINLIGKPDNLTGYMETTVNKTVFIKQIYFASCCIFRDWGSRAQWVIKPLDFWRPTVTGRCQLSLSRTQITQIYPRQSSNTGNNCVVLPENLSTGIRRKCQDICNFGFWKKRNCTIYVAKAKALIYAFVFAFAKTFFLMMRLK